MIFYKVKERKREKEKEKGRQKESKKERKREKEKEKGRQKESKKERKKERKKDRKKLKKETYISELHLVHALSDGNFEMLLVAPECVHLQLIQIDICKKNDLLLLSLNYDYHLIMIIIQIANAQLHMG